MSTTANTWTAVSGIYVAAMAGFGITTQELLQIAAAHRITVAASGRRLRSLQRRAAEKGAVFDLFGSLPTEKSG